MREDGDHAAGMKRQASGFDSSNLKYESRNLFGSDCRTFSA
jgi:hypothetical protein